MFIFSSWILTWMWQAGYPEISPNSIIGVVTGSSQNRRATKLRRLSRVFWVRAYRLWPWPQDPFGAFGAFGPFVVPRKGYDMTIQCKKWKHTEFWSWWLMMNHDDRANASENDGFRCKQRPHGRVILRFRRTFPEWLKMLRLLRFCQQGSPPKL